MTLDRAARFGLWSIAVTLTLTEGAFGVKLVHREEIAEGVYAAGLSDLYRSSNCGWVGLGDHTLLIDLPEGVDLSEFLSSVEKTTGKPVRAITFTRARPTDAEALAFLKQRGVHLLTPELEKSSGIQRIDYGAVAGEPGSALYLKASRALFAGPASVNGPRAKLPGSDTAAWIGVIEQLQKLPAKRVVPGYGSWGGPGLLERQRLFLRELRRQIAHKVTMSIPLSRIEKEIVIPAEFMVWMPYDTPSAEDIRHIYSEITVPNAPFNRRPPVRGAAAPHALVLIGDFPHEPGHIEDGLHPVFQATGVIPHFLFDVKGLTAENLSRVDLLVFLRDGYIFPDGPEGVCWMTPAQEQAVVDYVQGGGAFLNLHNSMGLYPDDGPYLRLVGGRYIGHGPLERFTTEVVDPDHPITQGVTDFFCADEQHTPPYEADKAHLLLRNRSDDGKAVAAAGWAYEPGKGRLCHLANGHTREALNHPMFQLLMRNAVNWLLRRPPTR